MLRLSEQGWTPRCRRVRVGVEELESRTVPSVLTPTQIRHAYGVDQVQFSANGKSIVGDGTGQTIAIIGAYDDSHIASDLDTFDRTFSIGGSTTLYQQYGAASKVLTKVTPQGISGTDPTNGLWELETALDVEWAHAIAPGAKILLVEARSSNFLDLFSAIDYARSQPGVSVVSMSWGSGEWSGETSYDSHFTTPAGHAGITFVAASGDQGAPGLWPALSDNVLSVGATTLTVDAAGNYKGETAWSDSGGGVSVYESKPAYQASISGSKRSGPDVAYNGDPSTGVYVYDSMPLNGTTGSWWQVGGTSAGAPQWAALIAIADQGRALQGKGSLDGPTQTLPAIYNMPASDFHDITKGSNGHPAGTGYDLVTGRGSPIASRVIPDLVRADSHGALTSTSSTVAKPASISGAARPSLLFSAIGAADAGTPPAAVPAASGVDVTFALTHPIDSQRPISAAAFHPPQSDTSLLPAVASASRPTSDVANPSAIATWEESTDDVGMSDLDAYFTAPLDDWTEP